MEELEGARQLLPGWVGWVGALHCVYAAAFAIVGSYIAWRIALIGYRPDAHWTERARRSFAARAASTLVFLGVPAFFGIIASRLVGPWSLFSPTTVGLMAGALAAIGVAFVHQRMLRRVLPNPPGFGRWLGGCAVMWLGVGPLLPIAGLLALFAPERLFSLAFAGWAAIGLIAFFVARSGVTLELLRALRLARRAGPRLTAIVARARARESMPAPRTYELSWPSVNALAYPAAGVLAFSDAALEHLSDEQLEAVAAHELGHLKEPRKVRVVRALGGLVLLPLAAGRPIMKTLGIEALLLSLLAALVVVVLLRRFALRMEKHADTHAEAHGETYARALEKLHELNALPAVLGRRGTHPDLYDRMQAAGTQPDFEKPRPPARFRAIAAASAALVTCVLVIVGSILSAEIFLDYETLALWHVATEERSWAIVELAELRADDGRLDEAVVLLEAADALEPDP